MIALNVASVTSFKISPADNVFIVSIFDLWVLASRPKTFALV